MKRNLKFEGTSGIKQWLETKKRETIKNTNIVKELVKKNIKVQYRNSAIGVVWTILNPLLNMLVMFLVFNGIFGNGDKTYSLYLLCGNIVFNMMRGATVQSLPSLVNNRGLLTKNKMSFAVFPLSYNISAIINFGFSFVALLGVMIVVWFQGVKVFSPSIFLTLIMLPALFMFSYGISLILSALYVFFRDVLHFYTVFLTLWTYLTPIFYTLDRFDDGPTAVLIKGIIKLNPMFHFVDYFRSVAYRCAATGAPLPTFGTTLTLYLIGAVFLAIGFLVYSLTKRRFIFNI